MVKDDNLYLKLEYFNPSGSIKDRMVPYLLSSIKDLKKDDCVVIASSGNTAISMAFILSIIQVKLLCIMKDNVNIQRLKTLESYGARYLIVKGVDDIEEFSEKLIGKLNKQGFNQFRFLNQHSNILNPYSYRKLAIEIINEVKRLDYYIAGIGTGGTLCGVAPILKKYYPNLIVIGILPKDKITNLFGINSKLEEIKFDLSICDEIRYVSDSESFEAKDAFNKLGYFLGNSTGACLSQYLKILNDSSITSKNTLIICADNNFKY